MGNIVCYNADGEVLQYYTQWDVNQKLIIKGADTSSAPDFHFLNANINVAYVVHSTTEGNSVIVDIPDVLLQYSVPLIVYIEYIEGTTEHSIRIPILPRTKPADYKFTDTDIGGPGSSSSVKVIDNLSTPDPLSALSANQGYIINEKIDDLDRAKADKSDLGEIVDVAVQDAIKDIELNGTPGRGIVSIERTFGDGSPGTIDTYTIKYTDNTTSTFDVYNGADGSGSSGGSITIINNLTSNNSSAALSAAQGSVIKGYIDNLEINKVSKNDLPDAISEEIEDAIASGSISGIKGDPGRGIVNISRTSGDSSPGTYDVYTITYTDNTTSLFSVYNGADGVGSGASGENGATFIPHVDSAGNLSWSNDKDLTNPSTVKIKPTRGTDYWTADDIAEIKSYVDEAILGGVW